jgi:single-stranded-DNA-specific exonuclease
MTDILIQRRAGSEAVATENGLPADLHPVLRRIYSGRCVGSALELERSLERLLPVELLSGCDRAAELLHEVLLADGRILIVGDFDADGATSCALAVRALRLMGARAVDYLVPNRFEYGYGLTPEIVALAQRRNPARPPDLIITVDNGISSLEGVAAANALGIRVLITDHHLPGRELPAAAAIVNPNQPGDAFPSKHLAGVGVIFYVMLALRKRLRDAHWFAQQNIAEPRLAELLDLVALGTVADVALLDHNNRILVAQGLGRIRRGAAGAGIRALIRVAKREAGRLTATDLGFALGPRLNAAGRLDDMSLGIECLLCDDEARALAMAEQLDELNRERRRIETEMQSQAQACLAQLASAALPAAGAVSLCLYHADWHQGVIGILASRLKDQLHCPVIAFAPAGEGEIKGSARSVAGLHIRDALDAVAARHPGLILKFGGHAMAAGLSLRQNDFVEFQSAFEAEVRRHLDPAELRGVVYSDGELAAEEISLHLAELLREAGPWGQGFPEPVFDGRFEVAQRRCVAARHVKFVLRLPGTERHIDAIAFNTRPEQCPAELAEIRIAYRLDVNEYRGQRSPQLIIEHILA